jgi:hypothetical protein
MSIEFYCDTLETTKEALSYGFKPIILGELSKTPIEKNWIEKYSSIATDVLLKEAERRLASNIGILVEPSRVICIDVDIQEHGMENWHNLLLQHDIEDIDSLSTPIVRTGSRGRHYYFQMETELEQASSYLFNKDTKHKITGIDVKRSGCLVYPGSVYGGCSSQKPHKCGMTNETCLFRGNPYEWIKSPADTPIAPMPQWLRKYIKTKREPKPTITTIVFIDDEKTDKIYDVIPLLQSRAESYNEWESHLKMAILMLLCVC